MAGTRPAMTKKFHAGSSHDNGAHPDHSARRPAERHPHQPSGARIERGDVVLPSPLEPGRPLNEHLVWLGKTIESKRKFLRRMYQEGVRYVCECKVSGGTISLLPNAVAMLPLLQMELILQLRSERPR